MHHVFWAVWIVGSVGAMLALLSIAHTRHREALSPRSIDDQRLFATRHDAFEQIVRRHEPHLRSVLAKRMHPSDVDDVLQELWVVVRSKMDQVERLSGDLLAWLVGIAKNLALNHLPKNARAQQNDRGFGWHRG